MQRTASSHFYPDLEALRGIASFSVLLGHCYLWAFSHGNEIGQTPFLRAVHTFFSGVFDPQPAVLLFFVLSGFVLGCQLDRVRITSATEYSAYIVRRLVRLMPALWLSLLLVVALRLLGATFNEDAHDQLAVTFEQLQQAFFLQGFGLNTVIWTLHVEIICSAVLPLMFLVVVRTGRIVNILIFLGLFAACLYVVTPLFVPFLVFFYVGIVIGYVPARINVLIRSRWAVVAAMAAFMIYFWAPQIPPGERALAYWLWNPWMWMEVGACFLIVYLVVQQRFALVNQTLQLPVFGFLGRISYSLYLFHYPVLIIVYQTIIYFFPAGETPSPVALRAFKFVVYSVTVGGISVFLAMLSYRFVEVPLARWGKIIAGRLSARGVLRNASQ